MAKATRAAAAVTVASAMAMAKATRAAAAVTVASAMAMAKATRAAATVTPYHFADKAADMATRCLKRRDRTFKLCTS